ncbi:MAG: CbtB-domain containing protein [Betaproteobacteria bacterium]|nr:CbtB-domain containing protein [Betaproteobacteria bacterium]
MTQTVDSNNVVSAPTESTIGEPASWWPSLAGLGLGVIILAMVGFAPGIAHNAAHDVRHTVAFPCH